MKKKMNVMERESCNKFSGYSYLLKEHLFTSSDFICEKKRSKKTNQKQTIWKTTTATKTKKHSQNKINQTKAVFSYVNIL